MQIKITRKESYSIYIDTNYININSIKLGEWYIAIFSDLLYLHKDGVIRDGIKDEYKDLGYWNTLYLHKDGVIRDGIKDEYKDLGYWNTFEEAYDFYQSYILKNKIETCIDTE
jgi:hypothetical protein